MGKGPGGHRDDRTRDAGRHRAAAGPPDPAPGAPVAPAHQSAAPQPARGPDLGTSWPGSRRPTRGAVGSRTVLRGALRPYRRRGRRRRARGSSRTPRRPQRPPLKDVRAPTAPSVARWLAGHGLAAEAARAEVAPGHSGTRPTGNAPTLAELLGDEHLRAVARPRRPRGVRRSPSATAPRSRARAGSPRAARKSERGLIQYVTRAMVRTSPLVPLHRGRHRRAGPGRRRPGRGALRRRHAVPGPGPGHAGLRPRRPPPGHGRRRC